MTHVWSGSSPYGRYLMHFSGNIVSLATITRKAVVLMKECFISHRNQLDKRNVFVSSETHGEVVISILLTQPLGSSVYPLNGNIQNVYSSVCIVRLRPWDYFGK